MIRPGRARDIPAIVASAINFATENYPDDKCDPVHIESVIVAALATEDAVVAVMEADDGVYAGCFVGGVGPNPLSGLPVLGEIIMWVEPQFRGHGGKLKGYVEDMCRSREWSGIAMSRPESADRAGKTFELWGYKPTERWYFKRIAA